MVNIHFIQAEEKWIMKQKTFDIITEFINWYHTEWKYYKNHSLIKQKEIRIQRAIENESEESSDDEYEFKCTKCYYGTNYKYHLTAHLKTHTTNPKRFGCDQCNFRSHYKKSFESHVKRHSDPNFVSPKKRINDQTWEFNCCKLHTNDVQQYLRHLRGPRHKKLMKWQNEQNENNKNKNKNTEHKEQIENELKEELSDGEAEYEIPFINEQNENENENESENEENSESEHRRKKQKQKRKKKKDKKKKHKHKKHQNDNENEENLENEQETNSKKKKVFLISLTTSMNKWCIQYMNSPKGCVFCCLCLFR